MEYIKATGNDTEEILRIVQDTIRTIYPRYYPQEVVDFFCELHCRENISKDIEAGFVGVLRVDGRIVGTGCYQDDHITRVYVKPEYQGRGYGSYIMQCLESEIGAKYDTAYLDASLPASHLYEKRGYQTLRHEKWDVENGRILVYEIMAKSLSYTSTDICNDGRFFVPQENTEKIEYAKATDITALTELRLAYLEEDHGRLSEDEIGIIRRDLPDYLKRNLNQNLFCYLVKEQEEIVACAFLLVVEKPMSPSFITGKTGTVLNVYTKPSCRHRGYARQIMEKLLADAVAKNLSVVDLKATEDGYRLYQSVGFVDDVSAYHLMKFVVR